MEGCLDGLVAGLAAVLAAGSADGPLGASGDGPESAAGGGSGAGGGTESETFPLFKPTEDFRFSRVSFMADVLLDFFGSRVALSPFLLPGGDMICNLRYRYHANLDVKHICQIFLGAMRTKLCNADPMFCVI